MKHTSLAITLLLVLIACCRCQKEHQPNEADDTIILVGEENYFKPLLDLIPDSLKNVFPSYLGDLPNGPIPPNIKGEYRIDSLQLLHSNYNSSDNTSEIHLLIRQQHNRVASVKIHQSTTAQTDTAFVMGDVIVTENGTLQRFTLYLIENKDINFQGAHTVTRLVVFKGDKTPQGIQNLIYGSIVLDSDFEPTSYVGPFTPGAYFVYKDKDGLAQNDNWFDPEKGGTP